MRYLGKSEWVDPFKYAGDISGDIAFLYACIPFAGEDSHRSIICHEPLERISAADFSALDSRLTDNKAWYENFWVGYIAYEMHGSSYTLKPAHVTFPELEFTRFKFITVFNHDSGQVEYYAEDDNFCLLSHCIVESGTMPITDSPQVEGGCISNMTDAEYLAKVMTIKQKLEAGEVYQVNLTRKYFGKLSGEVNGLSLFAKLTASSPVPYSAYIKAGKRQIISLSPERFIRIDYSGKASTTPIKGTIRRSNDVVEDEKLKWELAGSEKDKAENLMIVDLMRNDFGKGAKAGTVKVEKLFAITSYKNLHHMSSTVIAQKEEGVSSLQFIKNCFPPGSMTGAPKIRAMQIISELEKQERGVYSGCLGWFAGDGSCNMAVVIRTILINENDFEFQAGGGIVADSIPEDELEELQVKIKFIRDMLGA